METQIWPDGILFDEVRSIIYCEVSNHKEPPKCTFCDKDVEGPVYKWKNSDCWTHKPCADNFLFPKQKQHPLHPQHALRFVPGPEAVKFFICDGCGELSWALNFYHCRLCKFFLHSKCATGDYILEASIQISKVKEVKNHFCHDHILSRCYAGMEFLQRCCVACLELVSGPLYVCFACEFFIHESCLECIPPTVEHPFHKQHHLSIFPLSQNKKYVCNACSGDIRDVMFQCDECDNFYSHLPCSNHPARGFSLSFHSHDLFYFGRSTVQRSVMCRVCGHQCTETDVFYRCVTCNLNVHFECMGLPSTTKVIYHRHCLTLVDSLDEGDSDEYYCDICEERRDPKHHFYFCKDCNNYEAHIECAVGQYRNFNHEHALSFNFWELSKHTEKHICNGCYLPISGPAYVCETCNFWLDESCVQLPQEMHYRQHPYLLRLEKSDHNFICDECENISASPFRFSCSECPSPVVVDAKCASRFVKHVIAGEAKGLMDNISRTSIDYVFHEHKLTLYNTGKNSCVSNWTNFVLKFEYFDHIPTLDCWMCLSPIHGSTYGCKECKFYIHESCVEIPQELHHPSHCHKLYRQRSPENYDSVVYCRVCGQFLWTIYYSCIECDFDLDPYCALSSTLKLRCHEHCLIYVPYASPRLSCSHCGKICYYSFYSCGECKFYVHSDCLSLPPAVNLSFHVHSLLLSGPFLKDYYAEIRCNICQKRRIPWNRAYCCVDCSYFVHIECALLEKESDVVLLPNLKTMDWQTFNLDNKDLEFNVEKQDKASHFENDQALEISADKYGNDNEAIEKPIAENSELETVHMDDISSLSVDSFYTNSDTNRSKRIFDSKKGASDGDQDVDFWLPSLVHQSQNATNCGKGYAEVLPSGEAGSRCEEVKDYTGRMTDFKEDIGDHEIDECLASCSHVAPLSQNSTNCNEVKDDVKDETKSNETKETISLVVSDKSWRFCMRFHGAQP